MAMSHEWDHLRPMTSAPYLCMPLDDHVTPWLSQTQGRWAPMGVFQIGKQPGAARGYGGQRWNTVLV